MIIEYGLFGVLWRFIMSFVTSNFENIHDNHMGWFSTFFSGMGIIVIVNAVFMLFNLVSCLRAASKANNGETWSSRFAFHFVK
jgi:uncharacterized Tic20 family protein